jgi:prolyl-tRNA synthetase
MKYSQLLIPTTKETPAEAEIPSHQLMLRAGFMRKVASGTYTYLALGWRSLRKIMQIVREEMDAAGAQEISMPVLQPIELWDKTQRREDYGETLAIHVDRHGRTNALAPTAEEVVTDLVAHEVNSYKQLPMNLYQIQTKVRDEFRPRFGALRSREFLMKDAYSFHASLESLQETYDRMYTAYSRIFARCGLDAVVVDAQSGEIGGSGSQEFMIPCSAGEDVIVHTPDGRYAANIEKAAVDPLAPPENLDALRADVPPMEEVHTPQVGSIEAVCEFLGTKPEEMIKTLIFWKHAPEVQKNLAAIQQKIEDETIALAREKTDAEATAADARDEQLDETTTEQAAEAAAVVQVREDRLAKLNDALCREYAKLETVVVLLRGDHEVNEAKVRQLTGGEPVELADEQAIRSLTDSAVGFAGPMGLAEKGVSLLIDHAVAAMVSGVTGANKTDHHVRHVVPGRDFALAGERVTLADVRNAAPGDTHDGAELTFSRGIEVGHIFQLGTKYSRALEASFLDENGSSQPCIMGCYGIGINRIFASAIEAGHDDNGCILPITIAPFAVEVIPLNNDSDAVRDTAGRIYNELTAAGIEVLLDDRDQRPGVKFKDADLIGIPLRIVVGDRGLKEGNVEIKRRTDEKPALVPAESAVAEAKRIVEELTTQCTPGE